MKICLDAGHGLGNRDQRSYDPGAVGGGIQEADIALQWALTGKWVLAKYDIATYLTRESDIDASYLGTRDELAKAAGCTHYLSLHCNAANMFVRGTETIYRDTDDLILARLVQSAAVATVGSKNRGVKQESSITRDGKPLRLSVLDFRGPVALLEVAFISNSADRVQMMSRDVRVGFFNHLAKGLRA